MKVLRFAVINAGMFENEFQEVGKRKVSDMIAEALGRKDVNHKVFSVGECTENEDGSYALEKGKVFEPVSERDLASGIKKHESAMKKISAENKKKADAKRVEAAKAYNAKR